MNSGPTEYRTAQLNGMSRVTFIHQFIKTLAPTLTVMDIQMLTKVNVSGSCNAFYTLGSNPSLNFYRAGGGCPNMAYGSVIYHEYGHGVTDRVPGSPDDGDYHEGMSDTLAQFVENSPCVGPDFSGQNTGCLRNTDTSNQQYPCTAEEHTCGLVIGGAFWDMRTALSATLGISLALDMSRDYYIGQEMVGNHAINPSVTVDLLTLDDDNSDLTDGTPHDNEISGGFAAHNLPPPGAMRFYYPAGRPILVTPGIAHSLPITIEAVYGDPVDSSVKLAHKLGTGSFVTNSVTVVSHGVYTGTIVAASCRTPIRYYLSAISNNNITVRDPIAAPNLTFLTVSALGEQDAVSRTFQITSTWTATHSNGAQAGLWQQGLPAGNGSRGDPPTDYDGSGKCWLTGNAPGDSDVDGGTTILTSELMTVTNLTDPWVRYARWYSNSAGGAPHADIFTIQVSSTQASGWVTLEVVGPTTTSLNPEVDGGWFVRQHRLSELMTLGTNVRLRFIASDLGSGSVVEGAVDSFELFEYTCSEAPTPTPTTTPTQTSTSTSTSTPNPTSTPTSTPTETASPTSTPSPTPTETSTSTSTATETQTPSPTMTPEPTETLTPSPSPTPLVAAGDCNTDYRTDAGDLSALVLELFDGDGGQALAARGGSYPGEPSGCDANADSSIDAADMACNVRLIFMGPGACGQQ